MAQNDLITPFPFGLSSRGMPVIGGGGRETTGSVFFVSSTADGRADDVTSHGMSPTLPFATLDYAIGACTASKGDLIYIMPGHTETITTAGGIDLDVQGISVIGLGVGSKRPTFTFSTSTSASVTVDAASIYIENILFDGTGINGITQLIDVNSSDFHMRGCELIVAASGGNRVATVVKTDQNADRMIIEDCIFRGADVGSSGGTMIEVYTSSGSIDNVQIRSNYFFASMYSGGCIYVSGVAEGLVVRDNVIVTRGTSQTAISLAQNGSGVFIRNDCVGTSISSLINTSAYTGFSFVNNYGYDSDSTDYIGTLIPRTGTSIPSEQSLVDVITNQAQDLSYKKLNYLSVTADFTLSDWNTVASHEIFQVTGTVHMILVPVCLTDITSGGAITIILGTETTTNAMLSSTDATAIDTGEIWLSTTPNHYYAKSSVIDCVITGGKDVGYTIGTNAATGGSMIFHCWWEPISSDGNVAVGLGIAL